MKITNSLNVNLTFHTPPNLVGRAARPCYGKRPSLESAVYEDDVKLASALLNKKHLEPLECSLFVVECDLPKFLCSQLNRHRVGIGRCQQSLRLSKPEDVTFYWREGVPLPKGVEDRFRADEALIRQVIEEKQGKEQREMILRLVNDLLMVQYTTFFNAREFLSLYEKRNANDAQLEARMFVRALYEQIIETDWRHVL